MAPGITLNGFAISGNSASVSLVAAAGTAGGMHAVTISFTNSTAQTARRRLAVQARNARDRCAAQKKPVVMACLRPG